MKEYKPKKIYCPLCKRAVASWDGRTQIEVIVNCKKCSRRVIYHPTTDKTETKKIPPRTTASGKTFY